MRLMAELIKATFFDGPPRKVADEIEMAEVTNIRDMTVRKPVLPLSLKTCIWLRMKLLPVRILIPLLYSHPKTFLHSVYILRFEEA